MTALLSWLLVVLLIHLQEAHGLTSFPHNVVVAGTDPVTLTCDSVTPGAVTWMFVMHGEGEPVELGPGSGRSLTVSTVDTPNLGEYSCWSGGQKLWSAYLVHDGSDAEEEESASDSMLSCSAKSYNCVFSCHWTDTDYTMVRLGLGKDCAEGTKNCLWVNSSSQRSEGGFWFELSHSYPLYMEETSMIEVTAEAMTTQHFHRVTKKFYLRDIVKPDCPSKVKCEEVYDKLNVSIEPASSWSRPHSYFQLEHEIEYVFRDNGERGNSSSHLIPKTISKLRVRSRDVLVPSDWSLWTTWKLVMNHNGILDCNDV